MFLKGIIYPNICVCCQKLINVNKYNSNMHICDECLDFCRSFINEDNQCKVCSKNLDLSNEVELDNNMCTSCINDVDKYYFERCISVIDYNKLFRDMIMELKFNYNVKVADAFIKIIEDYIIKNRKYFESFDIITSVPIHKEKEKYRGFNQSVLIGEKLCVTLNIPFIDNLLLKRINTNSQSNLNYYERKRNIIDVFTLNKKYDIKNKKILVIDDVFTTGSTLSECAKVLINNDCREVECFCILKAR